MLEVCFFEQDSKMSNVGINSESNIYIPGRKSAS